MALAGEEMVYTVLHQAWSRLPAIPIADGATLRRLLGGASEAWFLDLEPGIRLETRGVSAEGTFLVLSGRVRCSLFGNELDLPEGHCALLPPNTPFVVRVGGRSPSLAAVVFNRRLAGPPPLEAG